MQCGLYFMPPREKTLAETASQVKLFALHTCAPYVRQPTSLSLERCATPGGGRGNLTYISELCKLYPDGYAGPFTLGVWWQDPAQQSV